MAGPDAGCKPRPPASGVILGAGSEAHGHLFPFLVERLQVIRLRFDLSGEFRQPGRVHLSPRDRPQCLKHDTIMRSAFAQALVKHGNDLDWIIQELERLIDRYHRQELEKQRQIVGQFTARYDKTAALIVLCKIHHGLAAVAAFSKHMLEEMERQRASAIKRSV